MPEQQTKHTVFIAPGYNSCNIYVMGYPMKDGQAPKDLSERYQDKWVRVGQLNHELKVRFLDEKYQHLKDDIEGQMGGTYFEIEAVEQLALS